MTRFTFKMLRLGRTLLLLTAVVAVGLTGCGGDDNPNNNGNNNNNNNGGDANHDGKLICGSGVAWVQGNSCESAEYGFIFKSNGVWQELERINGVWTLTEEAKWRTNGNTLVLYGSVSEDGAVEDRVQYEVYDDYMTAGGGTFKKCSGVVVGR